MKKFLAAVFILAVFGGIVFYIGWTQFKIKPENVGIVISKTDGIDKNPVENGKFSWHKQFLLPTNAILKSFSIKPVNIQKTVSGNTPQSNGADYSYSFDYSISLTVAPEVIPQLLEENKITDTEDLNAYLKNAADTIAQLSTEYMLKRYEENNSFRPESVRRDDLLRNIKIYNEFPEIDLTVFAVTRSILPNTNRNYSLQVNPSENIIKNDEITESKEETILEGEQL